MLDHVAIIVKNLDEAVELFSKLLGATEQKRLIYTDMQVVLLKIGEFKLEVIMPTSPTNRYWPELQRGGGLNHIAFKATSQQEVLDGVKKYGISISSVIETDQSILINVDPLPLQNVKIQFIIPKDR